ncbi:MAG: hypothetical protein SGI77_12915 [Pirellulaceae bacterium]|nr:hypothetical protein [Pirellulaceae bacterium]
MADDLNDFLRQAALRREARKKASGDSSAPARPVSSQKSNQQPIRTLSSNDDLDVIEPISIEQRHIVPHIPKPDRVSESVVKADKKRESHVKEVFGSSPAPLERQGKKKPKQQGQARAHVPTIATSNRDSSTADSGASMESGVGPQGNQRMTSLDMLKLLRNPDSLKLAFIASEIFGRKFQ